MATHGGDASGARVIADLTRAHKRAQMTMITLDTRETVYPFVLERCTIATATLIPDKQDGPRIPDRDYDD